MAEDGKENEKCQKVSKDDFTMLSLIGKGAYGKVILVKKKDNNTLYAMKILKKQNIVNSAKL